ncbi:SMI1/KNR4 family protein [Myroides sp. LJL116]
MDKTIEQHFKSLGGLFAIDENKKNDPSKEMLLSRIPKPLYDVLKSYNGCCFCKQVGIKVDMEIPILGHANYLPFKQFLPLEGNNNLFSIFESNSDLFKQDYLPFAEATPGDYFAVHINRGGIYFISHDFIKDNEAMYTLASDINVFFMSLVNYDESCDKEREIISVSISDDFEKIMEAYKKKMKGSSI